MKRYHPITLHIHSAWERQASMEGHFYNAQKLGIKHMYITDHDIRMGPRENQIDHFDFNKGVLRVEEPSPDPRRPKWYGFTTTQEDPGTSIAVKDGALVMEAVSNSKDWTTISTVFDTSQKRHEYALLANVFLHLNMLVSEPDDDVRVIVDVKLSQRPPEFLNGHILYVFGNTEGLDSPYATIKPMKNAGEFVRYALPLLQDAEKVGGGDNVLNTISFTVSARNGKTARLLVNHFSITWDIEFEEGRKAQQKLADTLGKKYGVTPYVTTEITGAGRHKICFSTKVPIINYKELAYKVTDEEAMEHVRRYGGIYSRNHPFDTIKDKIFFKEDPAVIEKLIQEIIDSFISNRAWGAKMVEVGYPIGHAGLPMETYLRLWDALSKAGIFISGYGDSDNHANDVHWFDGSNFVGYIFAEEPSEDAFIHSMCAGNLYTGDPVYMQKIGVSFSSTEGQIMGQVSESEHPGEAILELSNVPEGCRVIWTVNGENIKECSCKGNFTDKVAIPTANKVNFVRAALYKDERCIMLTNPLYQTTDKDVISNIPKERKFIHA